MIIISCHFVVVVVVDVVVQCSNNEFSGTNAFEQGAWDALSTDELAARTTMLATLLRHTRRLRTRHAECGNDQHDAGQMYEQTHELCSCLHLWLLLLNVEIV